MTKKLVVEHKPKKKSKIAKKQYTESGILSKRTMGGKQYSLKLETSSLRRAQKVEAAIKKKGYYARVLKRKGGYFVYAGPQIKGFKRPRKSEPKPRKPLTKKELAHIRVGKRDALINFTNDAIKELKRSQAEAKQFKFISSMEHVNRSHNLIRHMMKQGWAQERSLKRVTK